MDMEERIEQHLREAKAEWVAEAICDMDDMDLKHLAEDASYSRDAQIGELVCEHLRSYAFGELAVKQPGTDEPKQTYKTRCKQDYDTTTQYLLRKGYTIKVVEHKDGHYEFEYWGSPL